MSSDDHQPEPENSADGAPAAEADSMTSKLSRELSNWRRKRTTGRPRRPETNGNSFSSDSARTIKVRGHETLVVRKPKLVIKPSGNNS